LGKQSKRTKHERWHRDLSTRIGTDALDAKDLLRRKLFQAKPAKEILTILDDLHMTRDDMLEVLTDTIFEGDESLVKLDTKIKSAITREWNKKHPTLKKTVVEEEDTVEESEEEE
jgi:hypothetical protein